MKTLTLALFTALLCTTALAQHQTFTINPDASTVAFTLGGHDTTNGTFRVTKGEVHFDPASPHLSGLIDVSAASGTSGNVTRDKKMLNDVLQASQFADVTFAPQTYTGTLTPTGDSTLQVTGIFTLHGTPHTITVPLQLHIDGSRCTARAHFTVPYVQWGLKDPSIFILKVAKAVDINLTLIGFLAPTP
jgi:polyisoprenoid-binding protein YceI